eukprot:1563135-Rhodomonas_salina.2
MHGPASELGGRVRSRDFGDWSRIRLQLSAVVTVSAWCPSAAYRKPATVPAQLSQRRDAVEDFTEEHPSQLSQRRAAVD